MLKEFKMFKFYVVLRMCGKKLKWLVIFFLEDEREDNFVVDLD